MDRNDPWREPLDRGTEIPRSLVNEYGSKLARPREFAEEKTTLSEVIELNIGSWSMLDQTSPSNVGVGLFFRRIAQGTVHGHFALCVSSIAPGSSAYRAGIIEIGDKLLCLNEESVAGWNLATLRSKLQGIPGTFVALEFERHPSKRRKNEAHDHAYTINLMRGTAHFMDYYDEHEAFGTSTLTSVEAKKTKLLILRQEEQQLCLSIEECLREEHEELEIVYNERHQLSLTNSELLRRLQALESEDL